VDDAHPDSHAIRCKIRLATLRSGQTTPWRLDQELALYVKKLSHISARCRISLGYEHELLAEVKSLAEKHSIVEDLMKRFSDYEKYRIVKLMWDEDLLAAAPSTEVHQVQEFISGAKSAFRARM